MMILSCIFVTLALAREKISVKKNVNYHTSRRESSRILCSPLAEKDCRRLARREGKVVRSKELTSRFGDILHFIYASHSYTDLT